MRNWGKLQLVFVFVYFSMVVFLQKCREPARILVRTLWGHVVKEWERTVCGQETNRKSVIQKASLPSKASSSVEGPTTDLR